MSDLAFENPCSRVRRKFVRSLKSRAWLRLLIILISATSGLSASETVEIDLKRPLATIQAESVYNVCKTLVQPRYAGRLTGDEGYTAAAEWAARQFRSCGLLPFDAKDGYLQPFPSPYTIVNKAELKIGFKGKEAGLPTEPSMEALRVGTDFLPLLFSDSGSHTAEIVFAGWAISAPDLGYDDYAGVDVRGKFVLCFRGSPDEADRRFDSYNSLYPRVETAIKKGAKGILIVASEPQANPSSLWRAGIIHAVISEHAADLIMKEDGMSCSKLREILTAIKRPFSFVLHSLAQLTIVSRHFPAAIGYNVIGVAKGSDPSLRADGIVVGAHLDHCGRHMGLLFGGADDNASGSAVIIEVAKAFSRLNPKPRRSVLFVLFGGEEMRIMGSDYFSKHLPDVLEKVDGMLNADMVGEGDGLTCTLDPNSSDLGQIVRDAAANLNILTLIELLLSRSQVSDHLPFMLQGIRCASFSSNGPHLFYHRTGDSIYRINPDVLADSARLIFLTAARLANR